jgi:hypothetical protein
MVFQDAGRSGVEAVVSTQPSRNQLNEVTMTEPDADDLR